MTEEQWQILDDIYQSMPGFAGYHPDCGFFQFSDLRGERTIWVSVEPSGLHLSSNLDVASWKEWLDLFLKKATNGLGFEVRNAELG